VTTLRALWPRLLAAALLAAFLLSPQSFAPVFRRKISSSAREAAV